MKTFALFLVWGILMVGGLVGCATHLPGNPDYYWLNGKWSSAEKGYAAHDIELNVGNGNEISGSTQTLYRNGDLVSGKIEKGVVDKTGNVEFTAYRPNSRRKTETYRLKRVSDWVLEGQTETGSRVLFRKINN